MVSAPNSRSSSGPAPKSIPAAAHSSIVILDSDAVSRARAEEILRSRGYRATATPEPAVAVRVARQEQAGLVMTDTAMKVMEPIPGWERRRSDPPPAQVAAPDRDGYALLCPLEVDPTSARCPAVFLRENGGSVERPPPLRLGVVGFVPKPITVEALLQEVERTMPRRDQPPDVTGATTAPPRARAIPGPGFDALPKPLLKALVVDGDAGYRKFVRELLEPHGFEVHEAGDGQEGLRAARSRRPWLILTDVNMPGMDGFEFCRRVRRHSLLRHTPLVFLSSWDDYWERYHGLKLGADDYLSKQTPPRELLIRIQLTLKRYSDVGTRTNRGAGMEGGIELIGVPGMLQMCHLGRFTGLCTVRSGIERVQLGFREGEIISAQSSRAQGVEAVYELLAWTRGHFEFVPGKPGPGKSLGESFDHLLLEGCQRLDEARRETPPGGLSPAHEVDLIEQEGSAPFDAPRPPWK